jgi:hypothetical protein
MRKIILISVVIANSYLSKAQKNDSLAIYKQFIAISKGYQQTPLQASIKYTKTSNVIANVGDTNTANILFVFKTPTNGYVKFGNIEQIVSDTMIVMVNYDIKRIVVFEGSKKEIQAKMIKIGQTNYSDSACKMLAKIYKANLESLDQINSKITLQSVTNLFNTKIAKETIEMLFNTSNKQPIEMVTTKKYLKSITDSSIENLKMMAPHTINISNKGNYILMVQTEKYFFNYINYNKIERLPFEIIDRVIKKTFSNLLPAKGFEDFAIIKH